MENQAGQPQPPIPETSSFSWSVFANRILKAGFALLVFGAVALLLVEFQQVLPSTPDPLAFAGGAVALLALTLLGVPLVPAAVAGFAAWLLIQHFIL